MALSSEDNLNLTNANIDSKGKNGEQVYNTTFKHDFMNREQLFILEQSKCTRHAGNYTLTSNFQMLDNKICPYSNCSNINMETDTCITLLYMDAKS